MKKINYSLLGLACTVLLTLNASAPLPARAAQVFNVKSFGAVGNGVTDDSSALLAAAAAANAVPGSTLFFPEGNYLLHGILTVSGIEVDGDNATLTTSSTGGLEISGNKTRVHDMKFATQVSSGAVGILVINATGFEVRNNTFSAGFTDSVSVTQSSNGKINANKIFMSAAAISGVLLGNSSNVSAHNNVVGGITSGSAFLPANSNNITIDSNTVTGPDYGITSNQNSNDSYTSNTFNQCNKDGIDLNTDTQVNVNGNRFTNTGNVAVTVSNVTFADIDSNVMNTCQTGINVLGSPTTGSINVRGNTINDVDLNAISGSGVSALLVLNNTLEGARMAININGGRTLLAISSNKIARIRNAGIITTNCTGVTEIRNNTMSNCGFTAPNPPAVIYTNSPGAAQIRIQSNTYSGSRAALEYFIWCVQGEPPAQISGNHTNTTLPNRIGS